ncbi:MAG: hypothetical protein Athens071425_418 [Parcubacteria group bacterium Athens0714_25]|nr:MAG: hypothetical protein Athens071425_418 [Parcubacteria group bacterium Athens0714_25]
MAYFLTLFDKRLLLFYNITYASFIGAIERDIRLIPL